MHVRSQTVVVGHTVDELEEDVAQLLLLIVGELKQLRLGVVEPVEDGRHDNADKEVSPPRGKHTKWLLL